MKYHILASGYNCASFIEGCYNSLLKLEGNHNWDAFLIDDGSTDGGKTHKALLNLESDERIHRLFYEDNMGAAFRRFFVINNYDFDEDDVFILLGLDDEIKPNALNVIDRKYLAGAWMTYGNWITPSGEHLPKGFLQFDEATHLNRDYRKVQYRSTGLNTFKKFLFDQFTEDDFMVNGEWVKATTESNLMFSCLEMCGKDRIGIVEDFIALYNKGRKDNARHRFGSAYQDGIYANVISRPKRDLLKR